MRNRWTLGLTAAVISTLALVAGGCGDGGTGSGDGGTPADLPALDLGGDGPAREDRVFSNDAVLDVPGLDRGGGDGGGGDGGGGDGGGGDGGVNPSKFTCNPACGAGTFCTSNMRCAPPLYLTGDQVQVIQQLAQAAVDCWNYAAANNNENFLCWVIEDRGTDATVNDVMYDDWVCNNATDADFRGGQAELDVAKDLSGCGSITDQDNTCFKVSQIAPHTAGEYCLAFDNSLINEILFDHCTSFDASYAIAGF